MGNYKFFYPPKGEDSHHTYHSLVEKKIKSIDYPFKNFINHQIIGSALLILATIIAIAARQGRLKAESRSPR